MNEAVRRVRGLLYDDLEMKRRGPKSELPLLVLDLLAETGLSIDTILSLEPSNLSASRDHAVVWRGEEYPVSDVLWIRLFPILRGEGPLFVTRTGKRLSANSVRRTWANIQVRNGLTSKDGHPRYSTSKIRGME